MSEAYDFFRFEQDLAGLELWVKRVQAEYFDDLKLVKSAMEYLVSQKDRLRIVENMRGFALKNRCLNSQEKSSTCRELEKLWMEGLMQLPFLESTPGRIQEARELIATEKCRQALGILEDLERQEGPLIQIMRETEKALICLNDTSGLDTLRRKLARLSIF